MRQKHPPRTAPSRSAWRRVIAHTPCHHTCNRQGADLAETFYKIGRLDAIQPTYPCKQGRCEVTDRQRRPLSNHGGQRRQPHTVLHRIAASTAERDDAAVTRPSHEGCRHHAHSSLQHGTHLLTPSMMSEYSSSGMRCQVTGLPRRELLVVSAPASREDAVLRPGEWATNPDSERRCNARLTRECQITTRCGADTLSRQWWYLWVASLPL